MHSIGRMRHMRMAEAFADWQNEAGACRALSSMGALVLQRIASSRLSSMFQLWKVGTACMQSRLCTGLPFQAICARKLVYGGCDT